MRTVFTTIGIFAALAALTACTKTALHPASSPDEGPARVSTRVIEPEELSDLLTYPARLTARVSSTVLADNDGVVRKLPVSIGQQMKAGQLVATIIHTDPVYNYAPLRALAPISGIVSALEVSEGQQVLKGQQLATLVDPADTRVLIEVPDGNLQILCSLCHRMKTLRTHGVRKVEAEIRKRARPPNVPEPERDGGKPQAAGAV